MYLREFGHSNVLSGYVDFGASQGVFRRFWSAIRWIAVTNLIAVDDGRRRMNVYIRGTEFLESDYSTASRNGTVRYW